MPNLASEELVQELVDSFRTLLDEALVVAIVSDYDLKQASEYKAAQDILEGLAKDVAFEEATGFNSSGIAEGLDGITDGLSTTETSNSHQRSRANDTDTTSSDLTSPTTENTFCVPKLTTFNSESEEDRALLLQSMFTDLKEYDIRHALKKANGDFQVALDDLLNIQYLKSTDQQPKGIDGFFQPEEDVEEIGKRGRKKGKKGKKPIGSPGSQTPRDDATSTDHAKNLKRQDEIAYLADRLNLPFDGVSEIYCRKRYASGATALEILDQHIQLGIEAEDDASKERAKELAAKYHNVPEHYMATLVQVTGSIPQWSDDIAALLSKHFAKNPWTQKLPINYTLTPLPKGEIEGFETGSYSNKAPVRQKDALQTIPTSTNLSYAQATERVQQYNRAKREAATSASQLFRRGASNSLYRQAAGYYVGVAREQSRYEHQASSTAADVLVEEQSTPTSIDLHGVYVQDGVRIARAKVQSWWNSLGEFRAEKARQQPLTVITGLGRHSAGGVSQLRQAVAAALLQEGWRIRVETGRFVVTGRR
ncbi:hypothetical protein BGZ63DRAFT_361694 [Mariannaea sp. PMI_226]|nr:hypothetical protein BGZ63DRAFT_361694 [Mariannaea sp. PMI_226]